MNNYNIEIDLTKMDGAQEIDVTAGSGIRHGVFLPIDPSTGTVTKREKGVVLSLAALSQPHWVRGQSHLIKPRINKETLNKLTEEQRLQVPWVGNMKPWDK